MPKLFVYDASEVNREGYMWNSYKWGYWTIEKGFRQALTRLNPPIPFLVRTIFGD